MIPISEKEEKDIDMIVDSETNFDIILSNNKRIKLDDIFVYGAININSKEDINLLNSKDIITLEAYEASIIDSNFDYNKGCIYSDDEGTFRWHHTWDKIKWFKYNHCLLGKPERIMIYRVRKTVALC